MRTSGISHDLRIHSERSFFRGFFFGALLSSIASRSAESFLPRSLASGVLDISASFATCLARHAGSAHCRFRRSDLPLQTSAEGITPRCPEPPRVVLYAGDSSPISAISTSFNASGLQAENTSENLNASGPCLIIALASRYFGAAFEFAVLM